MKYNEQGRCPNCGGYNIDYDVLELIDGESVYYPCTCMDCGTNFKEYYTLKFDENIVV